MFPALQQFQPYHHHDFPSIRLLHEFTQDLRPTLPALFEFLLVRRRRISLGGCLGLFRDCLLHRSLWRLHSLWLQHHCIRRILRHLFPGHINHRHSTLLGYHTLGQWGFRSLLPLPPFCISFPMTSGNFQLMHPSIHIIHRQRRLLHRSLRLRHRHTHTLGRDCSWNRLPILRPNNRTLTLQVTSPRTLTFHCLLHQGLILRRTLIRPPIDHIKKPCFSAIHD